MPSFGGHVFLKWCIGVEGHGDEYGDTHTALMIVPLLKEGRPPPIPTQLAGQVSVRHWEDCIVSAEHTQCELHMHVRHLCASVVSLKTEDCSL